MKIYTVRTNRDLEPRLLAAEVKRETPTYYVPGQRDDGFYELQVPKSSACLTPKAAWEQYHARQKMVWKRIMDELQVCQTQMAKAARAIAELEANDG